MQIVDLAVAVVIGGATLNLVNALVSYPSAGQRQGERLQT